MNRFLSVLGGLALLAIFALPGVFMFVDHNAVDRGWNYKPVLATEAEMMKSLKPATATQTTALQEAFAKGGDPMLVAAAKKIYVATADVALAFVEQPMMIILPVGLKLTQGSLGNIVVLRTAGTTLDDIKLDGYAFTDPLCEAQFLGMAPKVCNDLTVQKPGDWNTMVADMRRPTEAELKKWLGKDYVEGNTDSYYVATRNFVAAPQYRFDGAQNAPHDLTSGIFLMPGVQVTGGQLGYMELYRLTEAGAYDAIVTDSLCFMAGTPKVWPKEASDKAARSNYARTADFAPATEVERVSACTR
jgi:hypothetical protein